MSSHGVFEELNPIFHPNGVALIGASAKPGKIGRVMMERFIESGFQPLYPVNPNENQVLGIKAYASILDVPYNVDLAIIVTPTDAVLSTVIECTRKKVKTIVITTSGFGEIDESGKKIQEEIVKVARKAGSRVIGPNCIGIYCPRSKLPYTLKPGMEPGTVGVVSQSGFFADYLTYTATRCGINFSKAVSCGNECDLTLTDFLEYLGEDPETETIVVYVEGVKDGRRFIHVAKEVSKRKPVILWKGGMTEAGSIAASSHTGAIAGSRAIWEGALRQSGVIRVKSFEEVIDALLVFYLQPLPKGNRIGIVSAPGGMAVATTDACLELGLDVPGFSEHSLNRLRNIIPSVGGSIKNPVDLSLAALVDPDIHGKSIRAIEEEDNIDMMLLIAIIGGERLYKILFEDYHEKKLKKPLAVAVMEEGIESYGRELSYLCGKGISVYPDASRAAKALSLLWNYASFRKNKKGEKKRSLQSPNEKMPPSSALSIIENAIREKRSFLSEHESKEVFKAYGIPVTREIEVYNESELKKAIHEIGFPVVIKAGGKGVSHKTDYGLVYLNIKNQDDALSIYHEIMKKREDHDNAILIQEMVNDKRELMAGLIRDKQFGPCVMFGLGGIFAEAMRDYVFRVAPLDIVDALEMLQEIKSKGIMEAIRGMQKIDTNELAFILVNIGKIGIYHPEIMEIDINPIMISEGRPFAVDGLIILEMKHQDTQ